MKLEWKSTKKLTTVKLAMPTKVLLGLGALAVTWTGTTQGAEVWAVIKMVLGA